MASSTFLQQAYLAYFGRPADVYGLSYYANKTDAQVIAAFSASPESQSFFGASDTLTQINTIYQNLFNRPAEPAGLLYWAGEINSGRLSLAQASMGILNGAQNNDKIAVTNKLAASVAFTASLDTTDEMIGYQGSAVITSARAFLASVGSDAASLTAATSKSALDATVYNVVTAGSAASSSVAGSTFTLTSDVNAVLGGAGNDTISGLLGTSGTYTVGDNIMGGAGTDTLNLIAVTGSDGDGGLVAVNGVESVNVRLLTTAYASAGDQVSLNAADWTGVTTLSNASSLANTQLDVSGLTDDTTIVLYGNTDINVAYNNTTTGATANAVLVNAGSAGTATTIGSASATNTANFDFDLADTGFVTDVNLEVRGTLNLARIEAGSNVATYTVTGTGNAALITNDTITSFNAAAAQGKIDVTFQGASDVVAKGGAGNDTFRFGTTISNGDSVNGGAGSDTVELTIGGFSRNLNTTNVEVASITFSDNAGGSVNASGSTVTTYNIYAGSASADATISEIVNGATIVIGATGNGLNDVSLDAASGAQTMTINFGTASGSLGVSGLTVSDVANVTINSLTNTTGTNVISSATFDSDALSVVITTNGGDADLTMSAIALGGVTSLSITTNGSAGFSLHSALDAATALTKVSLAASGTGADITLNDLGSGIGLNTILIDANAGADIFASAVTFGNSASATVGVYTISVDAENGSVVGTAAIAGSGIVVTTTGAASVNVNVNAQASSTVHIGDLTLLQGIATASAAGGTLNYSAGTIGNNAIVRFEEVNSSATFTGTQLVLGNVTLGVSAELNLWSGGVAASGVSDFDVQALNITLGQSAIAEIAKGSGIETTAGSVGSITVVAATGATATFGAIAASAVGSFTVNVESGASANFGNITTVASTNGATAAKVGSFELGGVDGAGVTFGTIAASGVGAIAVSGALDVVFGTITTNTVGTVDATRLTQSGLFTIDLSGVANAVEVNLGAGTNTIISGAGNDVITLKAGATGNDVIRYTVSSQGTDNIVNFFAGSTGADQIEVLVTIGSAAFLDGDGSAQVAGTDINLSAVINGTGSSATLAIDDNVIVFGTAFANTAAMQSFFNTGVILASAAVGSANFLVAWTDGTDTYVSLLDASIAAGSAGATTLASAGHTITTTTLAVISGVTPGALNAVNFDFV
jgi:hypothetical protein